MSVQRRSVRPRAGELTGRVALAAVAAAIAIMFAGSTLLTPLYELFRQQLGFSELTLTLIYAIYVVGNLLALLLFGHLSDQLGRRRVVLPTIAVATVSTLLYLRADSTAWLYWARMLSGLAIGLASGTATAWIAELYSGRDKSDAALLATSANLAGIAGGALVAGLLAQYAPWPLQLPFIVYLFSLALLMIFIARTQETVAVEGSRIAAKSFRPRLSVPSRIRTQFIAPAVTGFSTFALVGFYAALGPSVLLQSLSLSNRALGGGVVFELGVIALITTIATRSMASHVAMLSGLLLLLPSLLLLVLAQTQGSLSLLLIGTALGGVSCALGYRGSLQVVNQLAPGDRRAEVLSVYLLACYAGNSLPIIGVGLLSTLLDSLTASEVFAGTIAAVASAAVLMGWNSRHRVQASSH